MKTSANQSLQISGLLIAFLGLISFTFPVFTGLSLTVMIGILLSAGALIHTGQAFMSHDWRGFLLQAVIGVLYLAGGLLMLLNPILGLSTLTVLLSVFLVVQGLAEIIWGAVIQEENYSAEIMASGFVSLVLGLLIGTEIPANTEWVAGVLFGISLFSTGFSMLWYGRNADTGRR